MEDELSYQSNSYKARRERENETKNIPEKKVEKVVTSPVKVKKKGIFGRFTDSFLAEDLASVKTYILKDVLIPAVKKAMDDIFTGGIRMLLWGEKEKRFSAPASRVSYSGYYEKKDRTPIMKERYGCNEVIFESRGEAEEVLSSMEELIDMYHVASVADFYDLAGVEGGNYTDNRYGWTDIHSATVVRVRDGYLIRLPRALPLD